jgi:hypothetical protein
MTCSCHTSCLNSGNSGTLLTVLCSPEPTKKTARAQWSEFSAFESDDDDDDFLYDQLSVYHLNPADESDDSLSDSSFHNNYKHNNLSSDLLCQDEEMDSASEREGGSDEETNSMSEREGGSYVCASGSDDANPGPVIPPNDDTAFSSTPQFELVNLVLEIGAPLDSFHKIAQGAARANSCLRPHIQVQRLPTLENLPKRPHYKTQTGES